jgi:rubrerythrin
MDIGAIFLLLSVCFLTALFVARPFLDKTRQISATGDDQKLSTLLAERDRLIGALQELDFDHTLGKIPSEDYPTMRATLLQSAADVLRQLDELQPQISARKDAESRVEAEIALRRDDAPTGSEAKPAFSDDEIEELVAARRATRKEKAAGFCPKCGKPILRSDRFCPACGKPLS